MLLTTIILPLCAAGFVCAESPADSTTRSVSTQKIIVYADSSSTADVNGIPSPQISSVDDLMRAGTASLIMRGSMAGEATIRGMRGGQIVTTIDGMKVHSACVDNMDPATAYVELNNLQMLELNRGSSDLRYGATIGGSLNFRMKQANAGSPLRSVTDLLYGVNGNERRLRADVSGGTEDVGARIGYTYRASGDMMAGNSVGITGSNFQKHNLGGSFVWDVNDSNSITTEAIFDLAQFIGFPALLMDTRRAEAVIGSVKWKGAFASASTSSVRLYANTVDHTMDDYDRPVSQIVSRTFMPGMYMPMAGTSRTFGLLAESMWLIGGDALSVTLDATNLLAQATMTMEPIDSTVPDMRLTNLGDALVTTIGINAIWDHTINDDWYFRTSVRLDVSPRTLLDTLAQSTLSGYVPNAQFSRTLVATALSVDLTYLFSDECSGKVTLATSERLPTHLESYGFWLYNPQSNFVTIGQPELATERAWLADIRTDLTSDVIQGSLSGFVQLVDRYIAAMPYTNESVDTSQPDLRLYANVGQAVLSGIEVSCNITLAPFTNVGGVLNWTVGEALDVHDPLPLINPLHGLVRVTQQFATVTLEARFRSALAQSRFSSVLMPENETPSWFAMDLLGVWTATEHFQFRLALTNILDTFYHEHTSINDLASRGRSLTITVATTW